MCIFDVQQNNVYFKNYFSMKVGEVNNSAWLTYESSKLLHVITKLLLLKVIYWPVVTTKLKRNKDKLHELKLELGKSGKEEKTYTCAWRRLTHRKSPVVVFGVLVVIANTYWALPKGSAMSPLILIQSIKEASCLSTIERLSNWCLGYPDSKGRV